MSSFEGRFSHDNHSIMADINAYKSAHPEAQSAVACAGVNIFADIIAYKERMAGRDRQHRERRTSIQSQVRDIFRVSAHRRYGAPVSARRDW